MDRANEIYSSLRKKYKRTTTTFMMINITIFAVSAIIIVLNIFAIRKNPADEPTVKWLFVTIAILTAVSAFISTFISLYVFRKRNKKIMEKTDKINHEKEQYKDNLGKYSNVENKEALLIQIVTSILND